MKNLNLLLILSLIALASCGARKTNDEDSSQYIRKVNNPSATLSLSLSGDRLPREIDLNQDISNLSLQDLRLLRSYPYALHGFNFDEADINAFFRANTDWYEKQVWELWENDKLPLSYKDVQLTPEEQVFVDKIDKRISELLPANSIEENGQKLGNVENIINLFQFKEYDRDFLDKLRQNNFVITPGNHLQLFHLYEQNDYRQIPSFITTDLYLQAFHIYFSYILKSLEKEKFIPILTELTEGMYDECMRLTLSGSNAEITELAEYNATFYAIPYYFLTGKKLTVPERYKKDFEDEIAKINKEKDESSLFMSFTEAKFPYSLFKPRGHYTRKPEMKTYFKAMMWLQTAVFCREKEEQLRQSIFAASLLNTAKSKKGNPLLSLYSSVYEPIVFLVGLPDNLSMADISDYLKKKNINDLNVVLSADNIANINTMLIELTKTRNQIKPKIEISCPDKINFMPQRYLIDNDVLQNLVDIAPNSKRVYPKGLDVFAAFGSKSAADLLKNEKNDWKDYPVEFGKIQSKFKNYNQWNASIYNKWIESLLALQKTDKSYPGFMQTTAWGYKNLNTSLASWAELKHDAILYGEQPMAAECGDGGPDEPVVRGYVEPNLLFWNKLAEMVSLTQNLLKKHRLLTPDLKGKTEQLIEMTTFLQQVTKKELAGERLDVNEYNTIRIMGSSIEYFTLSVLDPDLNLYDWNSVEGPDKSIAVVADIYTRNILGCDKNGILHVAVGKANNIYVVVEIEGYLYLTRGATFSYYEFVRPLGTRLTDEEWQDMLEKEKVPALQKWIKDLMIDKEPKPEERMFYSSGC